jgi:hydrogenase maturation protease
MQRDNRILVLGIGNYLMGDEGVGVHLAERLAEINLPAYIEVVDGGTGGFHLLQYFEDHETVILVDATLDKNPVGTIRLIKPRYAKDFPQAMSTHDIGLRDMVNALQLMDKMPDIHLFVVSIESIQQQGITLTPEIEGIMPTLIKQVLELTGKLVLEKTIHEVADIV